ncbi:Crp/Fnr family transcriptional regulator [Orrella sp. 11846]|uniref:Crp/Fnr family transcriptional regulator n=1 Tax=Orrella sp. 11846 TaxID=3409913 RepID=UPI003B5AE5F9
MVRTTLELERMLLALNLFDGMAKAQLVWLISMAEHVELKRSEILFERGDRVDRFYVLVHGQLQFVMTGPPSTSSGDVTDRAPEKVVEIFSPGHTFGESVLLPKQRWIAQAKALGACRLLAFKQTDLLNAMKQSHELSVKILVSLSNRLETLLQDLESSSFRNAAQRVAEYVLNLPRSGPEANLQFHKRTIASKLGLQPETFSRSLKKLSTEGLITVNGPRIIIHDEAALASMAAVDSPV